MRVNATETMFEVVTVFGKSMLFTCLRIDKETVPPNLYVYEVRHDDDQQGEPVQIANWIMVNHCGTLISKESLPVVWNAQRGNAYLDIDPEKCWNYEGISATIQDYLNSTVL